jgi:bifunctional DNA-binding transcriptional regulator/antitoxin component of YhaV-PrlF toxin-antitoxin module
MAYPYGMEVMSTLTSKGQTTVPREVREVLGLGPRQRIVYEIEKGSVRMKAAGGSLMAAAGSLADGKPALGKDKERAAYRKARAARYTTKE